MSSAEPVVQVHADLVSVNTRIDFASDVEVTSYSKSEGHKRTLVNTLICSVS